MNPWGVWIVSLSLNYGFLCWGPWCSVDWVSGVLWSHVASARERRECAHSKNKQKNKPFAKVLDQK